MFWLLLALLAGYALQLPVTLETDAYHHQHTRTRHRLSISGLHKTWTTDGFSGAVAQIKSPRSRMMFTIFRSADKVRHFLRTHTHLQKLDVLLLLHTNDAAHTALLTGIIRPLVQLPRRNTRICIQPDFFRPYSTVQIRCIIRWKLGTLLLTSMMLLAAYIRQRVSESEA